MRALVKREIENIEPVQWAIDFLENMVDLYAEEDLQETFWERLLQEKKRELLEDFYALTPSFSQFYHGLGYCEGLDGGRMLVMRILMDVLPPYHALGCTRGKCVRGITLRLKTFENVMVYLKSLHLNYEGDSVLWKKSFFCAVRMLLNCRYTPYLFNRGGLPAFITAPPYQEKTAACYLFSPHVIVLYSLPKTNVAKRIYLILHEIGHLIFNKFLAGKPLPKNFILLLDNIAPENFPELMRPSSQGITEIFANLFAMAVMHGTEAGNVLFGNLYSKMGKTVPLLQNAFHPEFLLAK